MTITLALMLLQATAAPPADDWRALAPLPWRTPPVLGAEVTAYVTNEVRAGRCTPPAPGALSLTVAAHVTREGTIRAVVPQSIGCPTVEQFAAGLVAGFARGNLRGVTDGWYRVSVGFTLPG